MAFGVSLPFIFGSGSSSFVYIFDIGGFSVKVLLAEIKEHDHIVMRAAVEELYTAGDLDADIIASLDGVAATCTKALARIRAMSRGASAKEVIVGLSGTFIFGRNFTQFYARENPHAEIDLTELKHILQNAEQRAYEALRKDFARETGRPEPEAFILNAAVQEMKIDGYRVANNNPLGFRGREVSVSVFNSYVSRNYLQILQGLFTRLDLSVASFAYEPYVLHERFTHVLPQDYSAIFLDAGGSATTVSVVRKGRIEQVGTLPIGGNSFTQKIARELRLSFTEAEQVKLRYSAGQLSTAVSRKIAAILQNESSVFLRGLEIILGEFSQANLLPASLYLVGGGAQFSHLQRLLRKKEWRSSLSFIQPLRMYYVEKESASLQVEQKDFSYDMRWTIPFALAHWGAAGAERKQDVVSTTLKRMVKLIQA